MQTRSAKRVTVKDDVFGKFDFDLVRGTSSSRIVIFDAGIFSRGVAEFYLDVQTSVESQSFKVGNVEVSVEPCSALTYFLVGRMNENIGLGYELHEADVVRITGISSEFALEYLDKALFKMGISQEMGLVWPTAGIESPPDYFAEHLNSFSVEIGDRDFKHTSPINSFNGAMRSGNKHEKFLYLYKILEFFWRSAFLEKVVAIRTSDLDNQSYAAAILELNSFREVDRLNHLFQLLIDDEIREVLQTDVGLEFTTTEQLAKTIYDFRNSVVHSKEENVDKAAPSERYTGEFANDSLLEGIEYLGLKAIERWGLD